MHSCIDLEKELAKARRRLDRERTARLEAECIAERGLRDLFEKQEHIKLLQRIAMASNQTSIVADALSFALQEICTFTGWALGHAYLVSRNEDILLPTKIWFPDASGFEVFQTETERLSFVSGIGLPGRVFETREPTWISDLCEDLNFPRASQALACGLRASFAFPIFVSSEIVAILEFFSMSSQQLNQALLDIMSQIGVQLGRVIERQRSEERLIYDASHDPLTGLANRALFQDRLARAAEIHRSNPAHLYAVLFIDLDRFKLVNDSLGHLVGDELIIRIAHRLEQAIGSMPSQSLATLARLGGDEFTILLEQIAGPADAVRVAEAVQLCISAPQTAQGQTIHSGASIGVSCVGQEPRTAIEMLRDADIAMYRAKAAGRSRIEVFDVSMHQAAVKRLTLENDLRQALANDEFVLHYQPIIALGSARIAGFEALVRWQRGPDNLIHPNDFISVAEETGLIVFLGMWVLKTACETFARWSSTALADDQFTISVNISPRQFAQEDFADQVKSIILEAGIKPCHVRLELTENVTIGDPNRTIEVLSKLREFGVRIAIDDFGTGYSSLSYLQRLPLDVLKIDRSFVLAMAKDPNSRQIVQTIMNLAQSLGMDVIAEGTETAKDVFDLQAMGCQYGQGFFFSKPIDAHSAAALLAAEITAPVPAGTNALHSDRKTERKAERKRLLRSS